MAQVGVDPPRRDGIATNAVAPQIDGQRPGEPVHAGLGAAVGGMPGVGAQAFDRADIDDTAATLAQLRQQGLGQEHRGTHVDGHHAVPVILAHLVQRQLEHESGIVDQDVGAAESLLDRPRDDIGCFARG
ncbi:hypothetical protein D3C78_1540450 [compost metagenome]